MSNLFQSIQEISGFVKINANLSFNIINPYIDDARDMFIRRYIGSELLDKLEAYAKDRTGENPAMGALLPLIQRSLAPFTLLTATRETSINFGDTGHTVSRTDKLAPASDKKIADYMQSLQERGWNNLELALQFIETKNSEYPEFKIDTTHFFQSATDFQDNGLVDIQYSRLTFQTLFITMCSIEKKEIWKLLGNTLFNILLAKANTADVSDIEKGVIDLIKKYIANRVAFVMSNLKSTMQRAAPQYGVEYIPLFRPLSNSDEEGNFYEEESKFYMQELISMLKANAVELNYTPVETVLAFNDVDKTTFYMLG
jgi:hypothetical protein